MAEDVSVSAGGTHILVRSEGPPSLAEMEQTLAKIVQLHCDRQIDKVLVDSRGREGQPSVLNIYQGGELLVERLGARFRVAVLVRRREDDHILFEDVAVNRGASVAFFEQEELALRWLSKSEV